MAGLSNTQLDSARSGIYSPWNLVVSPPLHNLADAGSGTSGLEEDSIGLHMVAEYGHERAEKSFRVVLMIREDSLKFSR